MGKPIISRTKKFDKALKHIKDKNLKLKIFKAIKKIIENPESQEFLRYKKHERKVYIPPFRLIYEYNKEKNTITLIDFNKRDKIYKN